MTAQSSPSPERRILYKVDSVDGRKAGAPQPASPPTDAALEAEKPAVARLDEPLVFRINHPLYEHDGRAAWLADELLMPGSIFHDKVHVASDKSGKKQPRQKGGSTHITYATFTSVIGSMLNQSAYVEDICLPDALIADAIAEGPNSLSHQKVEQGGHLLAGLFRYYWRAVATAFADAWDDPHEHVLWNPHGLTALARLGGDVVEDQVAAYDIRQHYFDEVLERVAGSVSLAKAEHAKVPARQLSKHLHTLLAAARHPSAPHHPGLVAVPEDAVEITWGSAKPATSDGFEEMPLGPEN